MHDYLGKENLGKFNRNGKTMVISDNCARSGYLPGIMVSRMGLTFESSELLSLSSSEIKTRLLCASHSTVLLRILTTVRSPEFQVQKLCLPRHVPPVPAGNKAFRKWCVTLILSFSLTCLSSHAYSM